MTKQQIASCIEIEDYSELDMSMAEFKSLLDDCMAEIGATEETAFMHIEYAHDPYEPGGEMLVYVYRPETDKEEAAREQKERDEIESRFKAAAARQAAAERAQYLALKRKFEP